MQTDHTETQVVQENSAPVKTGFYMNAMPIVSKANDLVFFFLPGDMVITEHANRFKGLLGLEYTPRTPSTEKREYFPRIGFQAKIRIGLSSDGQWVTIYLPGNMGQIRNHRNAYLRAFGLPYERKVKIA